MMEHFIPMLPHVPHYIPEFLDELQHPMLARLLTTDLGPILVLLAPPLKR